MKKYVGYGLAALVGYYIGFYEMKYKALKCVIQATENNSNN